MISNRDWCEGAPLTRENAGEADDEKRGRRRKTKCLMKR
jgi:hypothetical protein